MLSHHLSRILLGCSIHNYWEYVISVHSEANGRAVIVGRANSLLKPMYYIIIFSTFDIISLIIQAIGGAGASEAEQKGTSTTNPTHIMVFPKKSKLIIGSRYMYPSCWQHRIYLDRDNAVVSHPSELVTPRNSHSLAKNQQVQIICCCCNDFGCDACAPCDLPCD